ncbi:MAG: tetratricopeptide repeat protein, partial [Proteobacteria bacterium]
MQRLVQSVGALVCALFLVLGFSAAFAADSKVTLLEGVDLPGFDYSVVKDVDLDQCQQACTDDRICRAFTFNEKAGWCFLKGGSKDEAQFKGATSGKVTLVPAAEVTSAVRQSEIPFPAQDLVDGAKYFASTLPTTDAPPKDVPYADLVASGDTATEQGNPAGALVSYRQALAINANDPSLWLKLGKAVMER